MSKKRAIIFVSICIFIIFSISVFAQRSAKKNSPQKAPVMPPAPVEVERIKKKAIQSVIHLVGSVDSPKMSNVSSEVVGLVKEIVVDEGDTVREGAVMVVLENTQLLIQLNEAKAGLRQEEENLKELETGPRPMELAKSKAAVLEAKALLTRTENDFKRNKGLYNKKVISHRQYTNSELETTAARELYQQRKFAYELLLEGTRKEQIAKQKAKVRMMAARVELIKERLQRKSIKSPFSGVVINKFVEKGEWIERGQKVVRVVQIDPLRIDIMVPGKVVSYVKIDDTTTISFDALNPGHIKGKVFAILPFADTASRTFPVRIRVRNPEGKMKVGMIARVSLSYGPKEDVLLVPQDALILSGRKKMIVVVGDDNRAVHIPVKTGRAVDDWIEINGNVRENQSVVTKGNERLMPGQPVQPISSAPSSKEKP
jgi:multidrug efflux pump subunit AcrA (membrane-fusion protein)